MPDLLLWKQLLSLDLASLPAPPPHTLHALLLAQADLPIEKKTPYLQTLAQYFPHAPASLRSAIAMFLGGSHGPMAWAFWLDALDQADADTLPFLLQAYRQSCAHDPARWVHALFHPDPAIRLQALSKRPEAFPSHYELLLFPDPNAHAALCERFRHRPPQGPEIATLLQLHQAQAIDVSTLQPWLHEAFLRPQNALDLLHHLPAPSTQSTYLPPDPDALWHHLASSPQQSDLLDVLLALLWPAPSSPSQACTVFLRSACLAIQQNKLAPSQHLRLATALLRVGSRSTQWTEDAARLLLSAIPRLFGTRYLSLSLRQQVARQILDDRPAVRLFDPLAEWIDTPLCLRPDGHFDLIVIAGLMGLDKSNPFQHLLSHLSPQILFDAVLRHPEGAVRMLRLQPHSSVDRLSYDALLGLVLQKAHTSPQFVAYALLHLPNKPLALFCEQMAEQPPALDLLLPYLTHALDLLCLPPSRKNRKLQHLAAVLAKTLSPQHARPLLYALAQTDQNALSIEILEQISRRLPPDQLAHKIAQLPLRSLRSMLSLIDQASGFSLEAEESVLLTLQHHPDPFIQTWLRQQQRLRLAQGSESRQRIEDTPRPLPEATLQRIARCADIDLEDALRPCYDFPTKGLCHALQRRKKPTPEVEVLAALLICHDPLHLILEQWKRFSDESPALYEQLDQRMATRCSDMRALPLCGLVWMYRWEQHLHTLAPALLRSPEAFASFLQQGLQIPIMPLRWRFWKAACLLLKKWRWHPPALLHLLFSAELEQLLLSVITLGHSAPNTAATLFFDETLQSIATDILLLLHKLPAALPTVRSLHNHLLPFLSSLPENLRTTVLLWMREQDFSFLSPPALLSHTHNTESLLHSIHHLHAPDALALYCLEDSPLLVEAAATKLIGYGESGLQRLLPLLSLSHQNTPPAQLRVLIRLVSSWPESPSLRALRAQLQLALDAISSDNTAPHPSVSPNDPVPYQPSTPPSLPIEDRLPTLLPAPNAPQRSSSTTPPTIEIQPCFLLTLAFLERGERSLSRYLPLLARIPANSPSPISKRPSHRHIHIHHRAQETPLSPRNTPAMWLTENDWERLLRLGISQEECAIWFATSDQYHAYAPAIRSLLQLLPENTLSTDTLTPSTPHTQNTLSTDTLTPSTPHTQNALSTDTLTPSTPHTQNALSTDTLTPYAPKTLSTERIAARLDALEGFLLCGPSRLEELRLQAAKRLLHYGRWLGYPLLLHTTLYQQKSSEELLSILRLLPISLIESTAHGLLMNHADPSFEQIFLKTVSLLPLTLEQKERIARPFLQHAQHALTQERALSLHRLPTERTESIQKLARLCAWGIRLGRQISGKVFRIRLIAGRDLGYTRLETPRIFINPLPLLRQERHAEEIVKGLILHELGHHLYHASPSSREIWKQAQQEGIQPLLNLVADEHLERNLRAKEQEFGHSLQSLAAYGFQHNQREIRAFFLLDQLGPSALETLTQSPPTAARMHGCIRIHTGGILREAERRGASFSRFIRALRMGLGNRFRDPLVAKALNLFHKDFRHLDMQGLYQIATKLRDIFSYQTRLLDDLDTEHTLGCDLTEIFRDSYGLTDEELQRAIEEELYPRPHAQPSALDEIERRNINLSKDLHFSPIHHVQPLLYSAEAAQQYAQQVAHESRNLRRYLHQLGLHLRPQKRRVQGHHIDTHVLRSAILRGDPRFLTARRLTPHNHLFLGVLIDCSGSMNGDSLEKAKAFASLIAEATVSIEGIDARFFGFNDTTLFDAGDARHCAIHALQSAGGNNDAAAMLHLAKLALASKRKARILVMISDGSPTECSVTALTALVQRITQKMHILCAQVAVRPLPSASFPHYIELTNDDIALSTHRFGQLIARLVAQSLRRT
ncbi:hypothetical protein L6R29_11825 [Myxococcota bacterium]|nr:hypothetical protein [Myxococcota bacterium]